MAMDTPSERYSAMNVMCPWRGSLPLPDGTVNQVDRQHVPFMYSGISSSTVPPAGGDLSWIEPLRIRRFLRLRRGGHRRWGNL
jgi:hypothetical protein